MVSLGGSVRLRALIYLCDGVCSQLPLLTDEQPRGARSMSGRNCPITFLSWCRWGGRFGCGLTKYLCDGVFWQLPLRTDKQPSLGTIHVGTKLPHYFFCRVARVKRGRTEQNVSRQCYKSNALCCPIPRGHAEHARVGKAYQHQPNNWSDGLPLTSNHAQTKLPH